MLNKAAGEGHRAARGYIYFFVRANREPRARVRTHETKGEGGIVITREPWLCLLLSLDLPSDTAQNTSKLEGEWREALISVFVRRAQHEVFRSKPGRLTHSDRPPTIPVVHSSEKFNLTARTHHRTHCRTITPKNYLGTYTARNICTVG